MTCLFVILGINGITAGDCKDTGTPGAKLFSGESITANPVAVFLESRKGLASETCVFDEGYNMLETVDEATSPTDPFIYAVASRDLNPIHRNYYIAEVAWKVCF